MSELIHILSNQLKHTLNVFEYNFLGFNGN